MADARDLGALAWQAHAACRGLPVRWFFPVDENDEPLKEPPPSIKDRCDRCPVVDDCLAYALTYDEAGIWGGTTDHQRRQLKRPWARTSCPGCGDQLIDRYRAPGYGVCLICGLSWPLPDDNDDD